MPTQPSARPSDLDVYLMAEGTHRRLHDFMGCHLDADGARFCVWAPNASAVSVIGDWNGWNRDADPLRPLAGSCGLWAGHVRGVSPGARYKYRVAGPGGRHAADKADPFAVFAECPPNTASRAWPLAHEWRDGSWRAQRTSRNALDAPMSFYEVHLGSWRRPDGHMPAYRDIAEVLADHVSAMGFTHVELMPLTEHPFYGSWGYQTTGYFAATARHGEPEDLMHLVDVLHQRGIGVVLDWVPSHFPTDEHGLQYFDGTHLYEHADPRQGFHPDWNSSIFNYGRGEVRSFLISSAMAWIERYHLDGLRVDAVASMLYLDYGRQSGGWIPNRHGGHENLEAITFLRELNAAAKAEHPGVLMIAEESTAWPAVTGPVDHGGLGFDLKWNMGWMHDTLSFLKEDPVHRRHHLGRLTFPLVYAFNENFVLPLSHDEVVHGKGSLLGRMPGDDWQRFANLRLLFGLMWTQPGKKLLFMGGEFGQRHEWGHDGELDWSGARAPAHDGLARLVGDLNRLMSSQAALHAMDFSAAGFEWVEARDADTTVIAYARHGGGGSPPLMVVANLTPVPRPHYRVGAVREGGWSVVLDTDAPSYGGSGWASHAPLRTSPKPAHGRPHSLDLALPPLAVLVLAPVASGGTPVAI